MFPELVRFATHLQRQVAKDDPAFAAELLELLTQIYARGHSSPSLNLAPGSNKRKIPARGPDREVSQIVR